eukprot:1182487-Amphidinium_carterae.2
MALEQHALLSGYPKYIVYTALNMYARNPRVLVVWKSRFVDDMVLVCSGVHFVANVSRYLCLAYRQLMAAIPRH